MDIYDVAKSLREGRKIKDKQTGALLHVDSAGNFLDENGKEIEVNGTLIYHASNLDEFVRKFTEFENVEIVPEEILDDVEKEYLGSLIKPFKRKHEVEIKKECWCITTSGGDTHLSRIAVLIDRGRVRITLPEFQRDSMYKKMKPNKVYSLEELGL